MTSKNNNEHIEPENKQKPSKTGAVVTDGSDVKSSDKASNEKSDKAKDSKADKKETPTNIEKKVDESTNSKKPATTQAPAKKSRKLSIAAIIISLLVGGALTFKIQQQNQDHLSQIEALKSELKQSQSDLIERIESIQEETINQTSKIVNRSEVVLNQQHKSIESLQLAIADVKGRRPNDWLLAEADYLVKLAGRKLFLEQDVVSATKLMESADQRIASLNDPSLVPLRKAMANDITHLKSVPIIDRDGLILRLTSLQQQVDTLPLANAILPEAQVQEKQVVTNDVYDWQQNLITSLKDFSENFITYRTRDGNVIPLLSPKQDFYLRENVKAKLETAIKATYVEQQEIYSTALTTAHQWSSSFFNAEENSVKEFTASIEFLGKQNIQVKYPVKLETQNILSDVITERLRREVTTLVTEDK
ncbi:uroporphyrinogen-III C-methyltransferase [Vibrio sp. ZSDE26]|uniref:Uroporphyrinogen-III C-methyltransferase n=1 Tax=Vibrio amylolyticus TaxID=2847292 RepID=A0A9X1XLZ0_9VIBR|nr:uroporphyrinogen-III C-methyltransferase [Vibrio amylolyticus]MCK6265722.1 uroporphyrinogen-III C-methyltransferase [Vibrio amylolyticus]